MTENMYKFLAGFTGGIIGLLSPIVPLVIVCYLFILADVWTAFQLGKRVSYEAKKIGIKVDKDSDKFKTSKAKKVIKSMIDISALIFLSYLLDVRVLEHLNGMFLANYTAGVFCLLQAWSILENSSSCNGSTWAKAMQKIVVDKTERHFNVDLSQFNNENIQSHPESTCHFLKKKAENTSETNN